MVMAMIKVQEKKIKVSFNLVTTPSDGCDEDNDIVISAKFMGAKNHRVSSLAEHCLSDWLMATNQSMQA